MELLPVRTVAFIVAFPKGIGSGVCIFLFQTLSEVHILYSSIYYSTPFYSACTRHNFAFLVCIFFAWFFKLSFMEHRPHFQKYELKYPSLVDLITNCGTLHNIQTRSSVHFWTKVLAKHINSVDLFSMTFIIQFYQVEKSGQGKTRWTSVKNFQFPIQITQFKYPAKVTQRIYGKRNHAAAFETR